MNLEISKISKNLNEISDELNRYNKYLHDALLTKFINDRLSQTLTNYNIELEKNTSFLATRSGISVLKAIAKKSKQADKEIINSYLKDSEDD